jgi:hypothetical protein
MSGTPERSQALLFFLYFRNAVRAVYCFLKVHETFNSLDKYGYLTILNALLKCPLQTNLLPLLVNAMSDERQNQIFGQLLISRTSAQSDALV